MNPKSVKLTDSSHTIETGMNSKTLPQRSFIVRSSHNTSQVCRIVTNHLAANMTAFISPIERWSDKNYAPENLAYVYYQTPDSYEIIAPLHGFEANDVRVDLSRGHVIILLSRPYDAHNRVSKEYYCEVPIPTDANGNQAHIEINPDRLVVQLSMNLGAFERIVYWTRNLKKDLVLLFGKYWNLGSLDA